MVHLAGASCMFIRSGLPLKLLLVYLAVSPLFCSADNFFEEKKAAADSSRPFYMGSRYGRSGQSSTKVHVTPRTDRFFMGSRYGKRAAGSDLGEIFSPYAGPDFQDDVHQLGAEMARPEFADHAVLLKCMYLGVGNLYRCHSRESEQMM